MAIETLTTQNKVIKLAASTSSPSGYLQNQIERKLGTRRRSEVLAKIGNTGVPYEQLLNGYINGLATGNYSRSFDSESTGAAGDYSTGGGSGAVLTIDNTVFYGASGKSLKLDNNSSNISHNWVFDTAATATSGDVTLTCQIRVNTVNDASSCRAGLVARITDSATDLCYVMMVRPQIVNTTLRLSKFSGSTETAISTADYGSQILADTWYTLKFSLSGTAIKGKLWLATDSEPGTWNIDTTDATYDNTLVKVGVYFFDGSVLSHNAYIDEIVAS